MTNKAQFSRRAILKLCATLGISASAASAFLGCVCEDFETQAQEGKTQEKPTTNEHDVIIVGAGAAGLTAGFLLRQAGWNVQLLEASTRIGGRLKKEEDFCDFPLELGAEWVHTNPSILNKLSQDSKARRRVVEYKPTTASVWNGSKLLKSNKSALSWRGEYRFKTTSWLDVFLDYMAPALKDRMRLGCQVTSIDYSGERVVLRTKSGDTYRAWYVIVTVPLRILHDGDITFKPRLPANKRLALKHCQMAGGLKMFIQFSEQFYPDVVLFNDRAAGHNERMYYNAALGKGSKANVLGLFAVGKYAEPYLRFEKDKELSAHVLNELDAMFDGAASRTYIKHLTQNWSKEPFIRGSYLIAPDTYSKHVSALSQPIDDKVFFAGEAYSMRDDWGYAHVAAQSSFDAVKRIKELS